MLIQINKTYISRITLKDIFSMPKISDWNMIYILKIKPNDWLLADTKPIIALYFELENELKFYNLDASIRQSNFDISRGFYFRESSRIRK